MTISYHEFKCLIEEKFKEHIEMLPFIEREQTLLQMAKMSVEELTRHIKYEEKFRVRNHKS